MMNRTRTYCDHEGNIIEQVQVDVEWATVRMERKMELEKTDLWYLKDRWDNLSTTDKGKLNSYRQALRDLPSTYETANEAVDNWPEPEDWF